MNTQLISVPFYDDMLVLIGEDNEPMVAMKPVVENLGLSWQGQHEKITDKLKSSIRKILIIAEDGKNREMVCLPLRKLPAWLYSINPNKVKPELRDKITRYQNECDDVLWEYWTKEKPAAGTVTIQLIAPREPMPDIPGGMRLKIRDLITLQQQYTSIMRAIEKADSPAIRAGLYVQLRFIADTIGHDVPELESFALPKLTPTPLLTNNQAN
jgi:hypothetical protein